MTPWIIAYQAPLSMGFSRQGYWSGLPFPSPGEKLICIDLAYSAFSGVSDSKESACNAEDPGSILGSGRSLEKGMATHSNILVWRIPWTEEPGAL